MAGPHVIINWGHKLAQAGLLVPLLSPCYKMTSRHPSSPNRHHPPHLPILMHPYQLRGQDLGQGGTYNISGLGPLPLAPAPPTPSPAHYAPFYPMGSPASSYYSPHFLMQYHTANLSLPPYPGQLYTMPVMIPSFHPQRNFDPLFYPYPNHNSSAGGCPTYLDSFYPLDHDLISKGGHHHGHDGTSSLESHSLPVADATIVSYFSFPLFTTSITVGRNWPHH